MTQTGVPVYDPSRTGYSRSGPRASWTDGVDATDAARRRAGELGVDLSSVTGTGQDGRVTREDVDKAGE